tara:strand:+ start:263 stop:430 length:168 start_codon:yes stop_codon:yes gene_type:complete
MDEETINKVREYIIISYNGLSDEEKEIIRLNREKEYAVVMRKLFPEEVFEGLSSA